MATSSAKKPDARKSSATAKPAAKAAPKAAKPMAKAAAKATVSAPRAVAPAVAADPAAEMILTPVAAGEKQARVAAPQLKKKELVARVVAALDGKKKGGVKEIVEATLAAMGEALQRGESLNIPPFGRARVARQKGEGADQMTTVRLRGAGSKNAPKGGKQALAEVGEDD
jgi:nucleoid DNA-binding protein